MQDDAYYEQQENAYRASLTPEQLLGYGRANREIADCPKCGAKDVELESWDHPDMVGACGD